MPMPPLGIATAARGVVLLLNAASMTRREALTSINHTKCQLFRRDPIAFPHPIAFLSIANRSEIHLEVRVSCRNAAATALPTESASCKHRLPRAAFDITVAR